MGLTNKRSKVESHTCYSCYCHRSVSFSVFISTLLSNDGNILNDFLSTLTVNKHCMLVLCDTSEITSN